MFYRPGNPALQEVFHLKAGYMWYIKRISRDNIKFTSSTVELLHSTARNQMITVGLIAVVWHIIATLSWPETFLRTIWLVTPVTLLICIVSFWLLPKRFLLAQVVWQVGLVVVITLALYIYQQPEMVFLYALLPLMAVVAVGRRAGLLAECGLIVVIGWLSYNQLTPLPLGYSIGVIMAGALTGVLGWAASDALLTVARWSLFHFNQAQSNLEAANRQRGEVVRVLKSLDQAYSQLERVNHMLVLARAQAEEAQEARNRFALAVSHELRTPLNFILGFSELMVNSPDTYTSLEEWPDGLYEDVNEIYRSTTHLQSLVNDILNLGQIEARQMPLFKEMVDLSQLVQDVKAMVEPVLTRKKLWFQTEIEPDLPPVFADRTRIRQVLLSLISNSLRFTEQGGITIRLRVEKNAILVNTEDTGPGIAPEDLSKLFKEFGQLEQSGWRRREGTGLGLTIGRRFVELHGGQMWVESEGVPGRGTKFYFTLPLSRTALDLSIAADEKTAETHSWSYAKRQAEKERLLLVLSPSPVAGDLIGHYLEDYGVVALADSSQVHSKITELLPNALIVDQAIIDQNHIQVVLQDLPYHLPVVSFVFPDIAGQLNYLPPGVANYLVKPVTRQRLLEAIWSIDRNIRSILVVDNDPAMVRFVTLALGNDENETISGSGYQVQAAFSGLEALAHLRQEPADVILLDLNLPDIQGWEVITRMQQEPVLAQTPIILITANDLPQALATDQQESLQILMGRPFSRQELGSLLKVALGTIQPMYPTLATLSGPTRPVNPSA